MTGGIEGTRLATLVRSAAGEVFSTMMGLDLQAVDPVTEIPVAGSEERVMALIGLAGVWNGTGTLSCSSWAGRKLAGCLLLQQFETVSEEVLDALGELANMIFGTVKNKLEEELGAMGLSVPTVILGRNLSAHSVGSKQWLVVPLQTETVPFELRLCLAPGGAASVAGRIPALAIAE